MLCAARALQEASRRRYCSIVVRFVQHGCGFGVQSSLGAVGVERVPFLLSHCTHLLEVE